MFYKKLFVFMSLLLVLVLSGCANPLKNVEVINVLKLGPCNGRYCWSPDGGYVSFINNRSLFVTNMEGSIKKEIYSGDIANPQWSPDGREILFQSNGNIWIHRIDTGRNFLITSSGICSNPSWHPDSSKILFFKSGWICIMDRDGSNQKNIKQVARETYPLFSPDGERICYYTPLYIMNIINADGSNHQQFTCYTIVPNWIWSKDSKEILYCDNRGDQKQVLSGVGRVLIEKNKVAIYPIVIASEVPKVMFIYSPHLIGIPEHISSFSYSPDGKIMAISLKREGIVNIYAVSSISPRYIVQLTNLGGDNPNWSPDGKKVLFSNNGEIGVVILK